MLLSVYFIRVRSKVPQVIFVQFVLVYSALLLFLTADVQPLIMASFWIFLLLEAWHFTGSVAAVSVELGDCPILCLQGCFFARQKSTNAQLFAQVWNYSFTCASCPEQKLSKEQGTRKFSSLYFPNIDQLSLLTLYAIFLNHCYPWFWRLLAFILTRDPLYCSTNYGPNLIKLAQAGEERHLMVVVVVFVALNFLLPRCCCCRRHRH